MDLSKEYMKENNIIPKISFKQDPKHIVKLVNEKKDTIKQPDGTEKPGMRYLIEEKGEQKIIRTASVGLISILADYSIGDTVDIEMKTKNEGGQMKTFFMVKAVDMKGSLGDNYEEATQALNNKDNKDNKDDEIPY